jgi:hypothetical protein
MANYRYLFTDLLTNAVNLELPLFGVTYNRRINKVGSATFSLSLGNRGTAGTPGDIGFSDSDILEATQPGRSCLWIERDGQIVWGGIIWSRTYQSQASVISYTAQTFESYLYKQIVEVKKSYVATDQRVILSDLITHMQAKSIYSNIGIIVPSTYDSSPAINRSTDFFSYIGWTYGRAAEYLINYDQGFDYTIECSYDTNYNLIKTLLVANTLGASLDVTQTTFDYPGNIKNYYYPESASNAATSMLGFGGGDGASMKRTKFIKQALLDKGYADLQESYDNKNVFNMDTLVNQTIAAGELATVPIIIPTIEVNPNMTPQFGTYMLGDYFKMHIEDLRFPIGKDITSRIIGWSATPSSSVSQEEVKLVVMGEDNG